MSENEGPPCPNCGKPLSGQYDTQAEEPYWWCDRGCDLTFAIDLEHETVCHTSVPYPEDLGDGYGPEWTKQKEVTS